MITAEVPPFTDQPSPIVAMLSDPARVPPIESPTGYRFSQRSWSALSGVRPELVAVAALALQLTAVDFVVTEGRRTLARQRELYADGATRTLRSRHLTGHAIDIAPMLKGEIRWDWPLYDQLSKTIKTAAQHLAVPITWGGDWASFRDGPHWELPWDVYPA